MITATPRTRALHAVTMVAVAASSSCLWALVVWAEVAASAADRAEADSEAQAADLAVVLAISVIFSVISLAVDGEAPPETARPVVKM